MDMKKEKMTEEKSKKRKEKTIKEKKPKNKVDLKKVFNKNTFLGVSLAGLLILVLIYFFVYMDFTEKTSELTQSNEDLQKVINELQGYANNINGYKEEIEGMKQQIEEIVAEYPVDAREEDVIMLAVQLQERNVIAYDAINIEEKENVYNVAGDMVRPADIEGLDEELVFVQKHAVYVNTTNYDNLKSIIEQVYRSDNRIGIDNIVYAKNEEDGTLEGNIDLYFYSLAGTDKEYETPDIAAYMSGTSDLFKSDKVTAKYVPEDAEGEEDGAEENEETAQ